MPVTFTLGAQFQVDANGGLARVATLTSTTAIAIYSSAASGIEARHLTNSGGTITGGTVLTIDANQADSVTICRLSNTTAVIGYCYGATHRVRVLSVSGTTLTANAITNMTDTGVDYLTCDLLDTNKVIYCYSDSGNNGEAVILTVSGTTITENAIFEFDGSTNILNCVIVAQTPTTAVVGWVVNSPVANQQAEALDISGTTITGNASIAIQTAAFNEDTGGSSLLDGALSVSDSDFVYFTTIDTTSNLSRFQLLSNAAGTLTREFGVNGVTLESGDINAVSIVPFLQTAGADPGYDLLVAVQNDNVADNLVIHENDAWFGDVGKDTSISTTAATTAEVHAKLFPGTTTAIAVWNASTEAIIITIVVASNLSLAPMTKPAAIDAEGDFIYLALLDSGTPILTKISTDLTADGTTVFDPGAGDNIGVECGRFDSNIVWVAGQFDGTNVIEISDDAGSTFTVADDGTIGGIRSFVMGPDSDNRLLVFDEDNGDILETKDGGNTWTTINAAVSPEINAIARLGKNVQESVFGNQGAANDSIDYSVNSGDDLEDYQTGVYPNANATRVIVN